MQGEAYEALKQHIQEHGQQDPVMVYDGEIVDGRAINRACRELGIQPRLQAWEGHGSVLEFILARNLFRRDLSPSQRAGIAAELVILRQAEGGGGSGVGGAAGPRANLPAGRVRDQVAREFGISPRTVANALKVRKDGVPALRRAVESGAVKASTAAELCDLPAEEQAAVAARGPEAVKEKATQLRRARGRKAGAAADTTSAEAGRPDKVEVRRDAKPQPLAAELVVLLGKKLARQLCKALERALQAEDRGGRAASRPPQDGRRGKAKPPPPAAPEETNGGAGQAGEAGPEPPDEPAPAPDVVVGRAGRGGRRGSAGGSKAASVSSPASGPSDGP